MQRLWQRLLQSLEASPPALDPQSRLRSACAVLLLECARADFDSHPAELEAVRTALASRFGLAEGELETLLGEAHSQAHSAVSLHEFVHQLNANLPPGEKRQIMAMLWRVAYADGRLDAHEEHLMRKLGDLLYVSQQDYIQTKLAAEEAAGG